MQEGPREDKHELIWLTRLIKEGKDREIHVGSILKATQEELVGAAPVRKESEQALVKGKWGQNNQREKGMGNSGEKQEGHQMHFEVKAGAWIRKEQKQS